MAITFCHSILQPVHLRSALQITLQRSVQRSKVRPRRWLSRLTFCWEFYILKAEGVILSIPGCGFRPTWLRGHAFSTSRSCPSVESTLLGGPPSRMALLLVFVFEGARFSYICCLSQRPRPNAGEKHAPHSPAQPWAAPRGCRGCTAALPASCLCTV